MPELLEIRGLTAGYGPLRVLHEVDLTVKAGERIGLVGLNGHGKTTLFRAITHMAGWQQGSIKLDGVEIGGTRSLGAGRRTSGIVRMGVAMAPQGDAIFPGLTVNQHLDCGAFTHTAWRERRQRREHIMEIFPPLRPLHISLLVKLSRGDRRMVSLGRILLVEAELYLIDEPSLGPAPPISRSVLDAHCSLPPQACAMIAPEQNATLLSVPLHRMIGMRAGRMRGEVGHVALS